jgi:hypothetical protein
MRRDILLPPLLLLLLAAPTIAAAGVPSATNSTLDPCLALCPAGDMQFHVLVRDFGGNPVASSFVWLDFSACPTFAHCPSVPPSLIVNDAARTIGGFTDASGAVTLPIPMGGICPGSGVRVLADGVLLAARSLASPDRDGNLLVDAADQTAVQGLVGTTDPTADFNCDGAVTAADVAILGQHLGHACAGPTPGRSRSWGEIKLIYR